MHLRTLMKAIAAVVMVLLLPVALAAPANAERTSQNDKAGDAGDDGDITKVTVRHKPRNVVIRVIYADKADPEELWLRIERPKGDGWDWELGTGMYQPRWYSIWERGADTEGDPKCSLKQRTTGKHTIRMVVPRRCFDKAKKVRVRVSYSDDDVQFGKHDATKWTRYVRSGR